MATGSLAAQDSRLYRAIEAIRQHLADVFASDNLLTLFVLAVAYFVTGRFGQKLVTANPIITAFWPPAGISIAAVLLRGNRIWPAIFTASFLVNFTAFGEFPAADKVGMALGIAFVNTIAALCAGYLVTRFANGTRAFYTPQGVLRFVFLATAPTLLTATVGVALMCRVGIVDWAKYWEIWGVWFSGDTVGALLLTPFLVLLLGHKHHSLGPRELFEAFLLLGGLIAASLLNFGPANIPWIPKAGLLYLSLPFLAWSALRFCPLEAAGTTLIMSGFAMWGSMHGYGPYGAATGAPLYIVGYVAVATTMTLVIAAASAQQRQESADLMELYYGLRKKTDEEVRLLQDTVESLQLEIGGEAGRQARRNNDANDRMN